MKIMRLSQQFFTSQQHMMLPCICCSKCWEHYRRIGYKK